MLLRPQWLDLKAAASELAARTKTSFGTASVRYLKMSSLFSSTAALPSDAQTNTMLLSTQNQPVLASEA